MVIVSINPHDKVLFINIGGIGDQIMLYPVIKQFRHSFPASKISVLTISRCHTAMQWFPGLDTVHEFNITYERPWSFYTWYNLRILLHLRRQGFKLAVNAKSISSRMGSLNIRLMLFIINARFTAGRNTENRGRFYSVSVFERDCDTRHMVDILLDLVRLLGVQTSEKTRLEIQISPLHIKKAEDFFKKYSLTPETTVLGLNPSAYKPMAEWKLVKWHKLVMLVLSQTDWSIIITAAHHNYQRFKKIISDDTEPSRIILEPIDLGLLPAIIQRIQVFVTADTGPMHIAVGVGTPVVALFGPTVHTMFKPYQHDARSVVLCGTSDCVRPCTQYNCVTRECMESIKPETVFKSITDLIARQ
ncbi:MAG: hypothetical protein GF384_04285 [Elusimicrobia bacterium]|nr:hypothetical protein [Elusimicrobiota bacterium]